MCLHLAKISVLEFNNRGSDEFWRISNFSDVESLLDRAIILGHTELSQEDIRLIKHSRKSLLFDPKGEAWHRKNSLFDVTMGAPDGAEVCELVGVYLLYKIREILPDDSDCGLIQR